MSIRLRTFALGLTLVVSTLYVRDAHALWPLSYHYYCPPASSPTQVECGFTVTNPGPSGYHYQWNFGDGTITGRSTSTTTTHTYAVSAGQTGYFNVTLLGYTSATSSLDNAIQCQIVVGNSYGVGGDPGSAGDC